MPLSTRFFADEVGASAIVGFDSVPMGKKYEAGFQKIAEGLIPL
jgi:hypothetical protein